MKNKEFYLDEICRAVATSDTCAFKRKHVFNGRSCGDTKCEYCWELADEWLNKEHEPEIDWEKVPMYTEVVVKYGIDWMDALFIAYAKDYKHGAFIVDDSFNALFSVFECRLKNHEDIEKYRKQV